MTLFAQTAIVESMSDLTVAQTILEQLGGREFVLLTGSRSFVGGDNFLSFALSPNKSRTLAPYTEKSDPNGYHALYVSSAPSEASFAARDKMREVITAAVGEHLRRNPEMVAAAAAHALAEDIERAETKVNELRANLAAAETELAALKGRA